MERNSLNLNMNNSAALQQTRSCLLLIIGGGLLVGLLTYLGQGLLPGDDLNTLVNSGSIWVLFAFFIGAFMPSTRWAIGAGIGTLLAEVAGYFASTTITLGFDSSIRGWIFWSVVAVVTGPVFGVAGYWWRSGDLRQRVIAVGLFGGVFATEGLYFLLYIPEKVISGWIELVVGLVLPLLLARSNKDRLYSYAVLPVLTLLGLGGYWLIGEAILHF